MGRRKHDARTPAEVDRIDRRIRAGLAAGYVMTEIARGMNLPAAFVSERVAAMRAAGVLPPRAEKPAPARGRRR